MYYYQIEAANGTTPSDVLSFKTAREAGDRSEFTIGILNDMGYTNAQGTHKQLIKAVADDGVSFFWHGGDISYADDWAEGIMPCEGGEDVVCYNGTFSELPGGIIDDPEYLEPLPKGEIAAQVILCDRFSQTHRELTTREVRGEATRAPFTNPAGTCGSNS